MEDSWLFVPRRRRQQLHRSGSGCVQVCNPVISHAFSLIYYRTDQWYIHMRHVTHLFSSTCIDTTQHMDDFEFLSAFWVTPTDLHCLQNSLGWPVCKTRASSHRYLTSAELTTLIIFLIIASPCRWTDIVVLFQMHPSHMSEIFWEGLRIFLRKRKYLLSDDLNGELIALQAIDYADAINKKCPAL